MKRLLSATLIFVMIFSTFSQVAYAATYSVGSADELASSWYDSNQGTDMSNTFNMTNDIDMDSTPLDVMHDRTYTINGKGNELSEVYFRDDDGVSKPSTESEGTVNVNADVTSNNSVAVWVDGNITVNVKGDVDANGKVTDSDRPFGVQAENGADVTIRGDITSDGHAYYVGNDDGAGGNNPEATLTVTGDITGKLSASANNGGIVSVGGDMKSDGVFLTNSSLEVDGNLNAGSVLYAVEGSDADIGGDVTAEVVSLQSSSSLTVGDDIKGHVTVDGSTLVVGDDITSDSGDALRVGTYHDQSGSWKDDKSIVKVGGNVTTTDKQGTAVVAGGHTTTIIEGNASGNLVDVDAYDHAQVVVKGKADNVLVADDASVKVGKKGNEITPPTNSSDPYFGLVAQPSNKPQETTTKKEKYISDADLIAMCKDFSSSGMNPLRLQWLNFGNVANELKNALNDELTFFNAVISSLFGHIDIITSSVIPKSPATLEIQEISYTAKHQNDFASTPWNESSVEQLLDADYINGYQVAVIREVLAKALDSQERPLKDAKEEIEEINSIAKKISNVYKYGALNEEMRDALDEAYKNGTFSYDEARDFAIKFLGYKKGQHGLSTAVKRVQDLSDFFATIDTIDDVFTTLEFAEYWFENYDSRINALDNMIKNQSMDAETFVAALELRTMMENKWMGTLEKFAEIGTDALVKEAMGAFPLLLATEAALDFVGYVSGISSRNDAIETGAALIGVLDDALYNYKALIEKVEKGDTSEETLSLLRSSFSMVTECFQMYYDALLQLTPKSSPDYAAYKRIRSAFENTYMGAKETIRIK